MPPTAVTATPSLVHEHWPNNLYIERVFQDGDIEAVARTAEVVVKRNYRFREAKILHFFGSAEEQRGTVMEHLLNHLECAGTFDDGAYELSIRQRHPWGPQPEAWRLMHSRNYVRAVLEKARQTARMIGGAGRPAQ